MSEHDFLHTLKEDLPESFAQELKAKLDALDEPARNKRIDNHHTFWTVAAASLVTVLLGVVLLVSRVPQLQMLVIAPPVPVPSFTQHDTITSANIDQLQPFATLGNGMITGMHVTPDGEHLLITATTGLFLHDAHNLSAEPEQIYEGSIGYYSDIDANGYLYGLAESIYSQSDTPITITRWNSVTGQRNDILQLDTLTSSAIGGIDVNPDGSQILLNVCLDFTTIEYFAVCTQRGYQWYDTGTGELLDTIPFQAGNPYPWSNQAISPDWSTIAFDIDAAESNGLVQSVVQLMNRETRETRTVISFSAPLSLELGGTPVIITGIEFSPDGKYLMTHSFAGQHTLHAIYDVEKLWQTDSPVNPGTDADAVRYRTYTSSDSAYHFFFAPDSLHGFAVSNDVLTQFDLTSEERTLQPTLTTNLNQGLQIHDTPIFAPDDSMVYLRSLGNIIMAYDSQTLNKIDETAYFQNDYGDAFQFTQDGSQVAVYSIHGGIPDIWTINTDMATHETFLPDGLLSPIGQFALSPDGNSVAYKLERVWEVTSSLWINNRDSSSPVQLPVADNPMGLQFLSDDSLISIIQRTTGGQSLMRWSISEAISSDFPVAKDEIPLSGNPSTNFMSIGRKNYAIAPDEQWFALSLCRLNDVTCRRDRFALWNLETGERTTLTDEQNFYEYGAMAFSPDSQLFAYGYCAEAIILENTVMNCNAPVVRFYMVDTLVSGVSTTDDVVYEPLFTLTEFENLPTNIAFHPVQQDGGSWLVAITEWNTRTQIWRVHPDGTAEVLRTLDDVRQPVAFDPTGGLMFTTADTAQTEVWGVPLP